MAPDELNALLEAGESANVEFKRSLADNRRIVETVAALATVGGGVILVGVRDDGAVVGVDIGEGELERLVQQILAGTDPKVFVDLKVLRRGAAKVLRIGVPPGDGPHLAFGRAWYRSGPATVAMTRDEYERRLLDRLRDSSGFERRTEPGESVDAIDLGEIARFCERAQGRTKLPLDVSHPVEVAQRLHLARDGRLTNGGALLFSKHPQGPLPQAVVRARAERGASEDHSAIEGTLFAQIDETVAFVARNLKTRAIRSGAVRRDVAELPLPAVREVIANAVAHRDYRSTAPIQLRLDDQGLSVWNPGHLPQPLTPASLKEPHPSIPTNPYLARALYLAGYIEEWGTGTTRVVDAMREAGNPEPIFALTGGDGLRVALPFAGALPPGLPARAVTVLSRFERGAAFRSADYAAAANVAARTAANDLVELERAGLVRRRGVGRATRWSRT